MMRSRFLAPRKPRLAFAAALLMVAGCTDGPQRLLVPDEANVAKGGGGTALAVTATTPSYGYQNETGKQVTITGTGFSQGAVAAWERNGVADPRITVVSTQYVSSTQLVATIDIAPDAELDLYDVSVTNSDRKKGIGTEKFEVTTAEVLGPGTTGGDAFTYGISDLEQMVGYAATAFYFDDANGMQSMGDGQAWAIDPLGEVALGRNGDFQPVAWAPQPGGGFAVTLLPLAGGAGANAVGAARAADGTLLVAGWEQVPVSKRQLRNRPVLWRRSGSSWSGPEVYVTPGVAASGRAVDAQGVMAGRTQLADGGFKGVIWTSPTTYVLLDGLVNGMNEAGTVVVGYTQTGLAVYWWRDPATQQWSSAVPLPPLAGSCTLAVSEARGVNDAGIIVGRSCGDNQKAQATVWRLDLSTSPPSLIGGPERLPGLGQTGTGNESSAASAITRTAPYVVAGHAIGGKSLAVRWRLQ